ncbi:MAG TPA: 2-hydroxyacid dehydrogenase [Solirubrobacteraceae bacterium]|jgi:phosphoglycerate dehydrogenase-like enzyme
MSIIVWMRDREQRQSLGPLPEGVELHLIPEGATPPAEIVDAEFLVPPYDSPAVLQLLGQMPRLAVVQAISAGTESLLPWIPKGVTLCNARGTRDTAVAEWILGAIFAMEKRLPTFAQRQQEHLWSHQLLEELAGKRALLVGYGSIGRCVAEKLTALGVHVEGVASKARSGVHGVEDLPRLLRTADIVVLTVPLTPLTNHLVDDRMLSQMRSGALLVNASRGAVLDTDALVTHLTAGHIRAALDVTDPEPLPAEHPLWDAPGVFLTPHLAGDSPQAEQRVYSFIGEQIRRYARGEPLHNVVVRTESDSGSSQEALS